MVLNEEDEEEEEERCIFSDDSGVSELQEQDGLRYLARWILFKHKKTTGFQGLGNYTKNLDHSQFNTTPNSWIRHLSYGGLIEPTDEFFAEVQKMEGLFCQKMGSGILKGPRINSRIAEAIMAELPSSNPIFVKTFVRQRIFIRMKYFSEKSQELTHKRKLERKFNTNVKLKKTCL